MGAILSLLTSFDVYVLSQGIDREGRFMERAFSLLSQHLHVREKLKSPDPFSVVTCDA